MSDMSEPEAAAGRSTGLRGGLVRRLGDDGVALGDLAQHPDGPPVGGLVADAGAAAPRAARAAAAREATAASPAASGSGPTAAGLTAAGRRGRTRAGPGPARRRSPGA